MSGVTGHRKCAKREAARKITEHHCHVYGEESKFQDHKMSLESIGKGEHNGLIAHCNYHFDYKLPQNMVAIRRIPCACDGCLDQAKLPWDPSIEDPSLQPCYQPIGDKCKFHQMFGSFNDWKIRMLKPHKEGDPEELEDTYSEVLIGVAE